LDSYTPSPETLEAIKDLFCHPEDFSPDFLEFARECVRNPGYRRDRIDEWAVLVKGSETQAPDGRFPFRR
jgi:hypothetical protein